MPIRHGDRHYPQVLLDNVFGGLQIWWIGSVFRRRDLARSLSEGEFR